VSRLVNEMDGDRKEDVIMKGRAIIDWVSWLTSRSFRVLHTRIYFLLGLQVVARLSNRDHFNYGCR